MTSLVARCILLAVASIILLFSVSIASPPFAPLADGALTPGYLLPEAYWGGVHDPLQTLVANTINVIFYSAVYFLVVKALQQRRTGNR